MSELKNICICIKNFDFDFISHESTIGERFTYYYSDTNDRVTIYLEPENKFMIQMIREEFDKYFEDIITNRDNKLNTLWVGNQQLT